jgi:hypothetical protein
MLSRAYVTGLALLLGLTASSAVAEEPRAPFPRTTVAVVGDSLADGIWSGIYRMLHADKSYLVYRGAKNSVGFAASPLTDMIDRAFANSQPSVLVMMIGANDRRSIFVEGQPPLLLRSPEWIVAYSARVANFMDHAGKRGVPLLWILLPVMRTPEATKDAQVINDIIAELARVRPHVTLLETADVTTDASGAYAAHFRDHNGQLRLMRASDGIHFEQPGYDFIAVLIVRRLRTMLPQFSSIAGH